MVSFKPTGRLGNFLFTAAAAIVYCRKHNLDFTVPIATNDMFWNPVYLPHLAQDIPVINRPLIIIKEQEYFRYDEIPFHELWRYENIRLEGYFQNPLYFEHQRELILKSFAYPWYLNKGTVSVHVRRGDYLTLRHKHPEVTVEWIEKAMSLFSGYQFVFFSDDIPWCKEIFGYRDDCLIIKKGNETDSLIGISQCEHHINSSSTFSWWGAWLNQNPDKIVITPERWFTPEVSNQWTEEIIPKSWVRI